MQEDKMQEDKMQEDKMQEDLTQRPCSHTGFVTSFRESFESAIAQDRSLLSLFAGTLSLVSCMQLD